MAGHWLFVCNPERWRLWDYLADGNGLRDLGWTAKRFLDEIEPGDDAALWVTGPHRGVYAIGRVTAGPASGEGDPYWVEAEDRDQERDFARLDLGCGLFGDPVLERDLLDDPRFADASIVHQPFTAGPHRLTGDQWLAIIERIY